MIELDNSKRIVIPPAICEGPILDEIVNKKYIHDRLKCLHIIRIEPYIDSLYVDYDAKKRKAIAYRFTIREGCRWDTETENIFHDVCVKDKECEYDETKMDKIYEWWSIKHPEWNLKKHYSNRLSLIDHIYNCVKENTAKEILYKNGLDELAANIDELDGINLFASDPSELYDDLPQYVLESLNSPEGAGLVNNQEGRQVIGELFTKHPEFFSKSLTDDQCRYIALLIRGDGI